MSRLQRDEDCVRRRWLMTRICNAIAYCSACDANLPLKSLSICDLSFKRMPIPENVGFQRTDFVCVVILILIYVYWKTMITNTTLFGLH
jgi:hypothetical protein